MKHILTKDFMKNNCGCYDPGDLASCSFMGNEIITLESILTSEIPLMDKYWFVCKKLATKEQNQQIAIAVAEIVLPIYESKYPNDFSVRECIEAIKLFISGHISLEELRSKRAAADAAYAAAAYAAAAAAAYDAAYAAAAAYAAVAAAAYDAYDAAAAAAAYDAAAADAKYNQQLLDYLINFCK
jgi:hypothetical protein